MADTKISALTSYTATIATDVLPIVDVTNSLTKKTTVSSLFTTIPIGTSSTPPVLIAAGTLMTTPSDGAIEVDANSMYGCTDAGNRGGIPLMHMIRQNADRAVFANNTNQQAIFDSVASGTLTLETGTYFFEALIGLKVTSATSGNIKFSLIGGGGATLAGILYTALAIDAANDTITAPSMISEIVATQVATNIATATTATVTTFWVRGTFQVTGAGTIIPSIAQTTGTASQVTTAGSFFMCNRFGSTTVTNIGQWT